MLGPRVSARRGYAVRGARRGARFSTVARRLQIGKGLDIRLDWWYVVPNGPAAVWFKVRHGIIEELGIADNASTGKCVERGLLRSLG
jgi:hypothetical protein